MIRVHRFENLDCLVFLADQTIDPEYVERIGKPATDLTVLLELVEGGQKSLKPSFVIRAGKLFHGLRVLSDGSRHVQKARGSLGLGILNHEGRERQTNLGIDETRLALQDGLELRDGFLRIAAREIAPTDDRLHDLRERIELQGALKMGHRFVEAPDAVEVLAVGLVRVGVAGVEFQRALELPLCPGKVPVPFEEKEGQRGVGLGQLVVEFEGAAHRSLTAGVGLIEGEVLVAGPAHGVGVAESVPGQGKLGIELHRLPEEFGALLHALEGALIPEVPTLQVEPVGLVAFGGACDGLCILDLAQPLREALADLAGHVLLDFEEIGEGAVEALAPQLRAAGHVDQFGADLHAPFYHLDVPGHDGVDLEGASHLQGVDVLSLEAEGGGARQHLEIFERGEAADQGLRDPVAQVLQAGVLIPTHEGQNRDRAHGARWRCVLCFSPEEDPANRESGDQHDRRDGEDGKPGFLARRLGGAGGAARAARAEETLEGEGGVAGRLEALGGILFEAVAQDAFLFLAHRAFYVSLGEGILVEDGLQGVGVRAASKGGLAGEHLVEHASQGEEIGARVDRLPPRLLGRHVADGADHLAGLGEGVDDGGVCGVVRRSERRQLQRDAEVEDLDAAVVGEEEVLGLEVAMDDVLGVHRGQGLGRLFRVLESLARGEGAAP